MRLLLDTPVYFWWRADRKRLSTTARRAIGDHGNTVHVSAATVWELSIKAHAKGWEDARVAHAREAGSLPLVHRDPFDRMLVAQARVDDLRLVSHERLLDAYGMSRLW